MKTGIVLLARMGSSRLPGKVLLNLCEKPVLLHIVDRLRKVDKTPTIIVATTTNPHDDTIIDLCRQESISFFRGSENNVLDRCIQAAQTYDLALTIRLGADSPFVDWEIINTMMRIFVSEKEKGNSLDYVSNSMERSLPLGLDVDIVTVDALRRVSQGISTFPLDERQMHESNVIPYIHQNPDKFNTYTYKTGHDLSHHRWTLDTPEDFEFTSKVYNKLYPQKQDFRMPDILALLDKNPDLQKINCHIIPRTGFWTEQERNRFREHYNMSFTP